jgi:hypothetical protein
VRSDENRLKKHLGLDGNKCAGEDVEFLRNKIMKNRTLYFGDNLEILRKKIPDELFDLITIDKVFGVGILNIVNLTVFSVSAGTAVFY